MKKLIFAGLLAMLWPHKSTAQVFQEVNYTPGKTVFTLFAPNDAKKVTVRIYQEGKDGKALKTVKMSRAGEELWTATIKGDLMGKFYTFDVGKGECAGVFAKAVGVNGKRGAIIDMKKTNPEHWCCDEHPVVKSPADLVVYEMHHRDFSIYRPDAKYPGKFLALTEPWAIDHLKQLGVNAIHILPSYDYGSVDETRLNELQYNWGYDPVNYNVPEGGYSTDPYQPEVRIREFKQMVQALHKAGIRVILDVVYNHTYDIEHSNFQRTYPDYFYRKTSDGAYSNGSGCGNETMNEIRAMVDEIDPTIYIYGEGWSAGSCAIPNEQLGMKANIPQMPAIGAFSDEIRDALRGPFSDDTKPGWLGGASEEESIKFGIAGAIAHPQVDMTKVNYSKEPWALEPTQMMSYVSCHDDMCLVDRLKASGVHNSFESPDEINRLDWSNKEKYPQVFEYYKNLIQLRKNHPAFRLGNADLVRKHLEFLEVPKGVVAFRLKNYAGRDDWRDIIVILNANKTSADVTIPNGNYTVVCCDGQINEQGLGTLKGDKAVVDPQSAIILHN